MSFEHWLRTEHAPGYCNLDYDWRPGVDVCWDVTKGLPFPDGHVGGIFTEHMLEHFDHAAACAFLGECYRVMKPKSIIRIVVPDGEIYVDEYVKHRRGESSAMPYWEADRTAHAATPIYSINRIFRSHGHQFIWDAEALGAALKAAGFAAIEKMSFGHGRNPVLVLDAAHRAVESLYVEAARP